MAKPKTTKSRSQHLGTELNEALISVFPLVDHEYFQELSFTQLLRLKQVLARVHDSVTLKLTFGLVNWIAVRFNFTPEQKAALWQKVEDQSANSSGFDVSWDHPHIIAEVKGCIPVNGGNVFGSAQTHSLTNDVRQMFGLPVKGKTMDQLSPRAKSRRSTNPEAIKLLALYDCPEVRKATLHWKQSLERRAWFQELTPPRSLQDAPDDGQPNDPTAIYLVHLTHSQSGLAK